MARKSTTTQKADKFGGRIHRVTSGELGDTNLEMYRNGFSMLLPPDHSIRKTGNVGVTWDQFIALQIRSGENIRNTGNGMNIRKSGSVPVLYFSSGNENKWGVDGIGTDGLGWIEWGLGNVLPNVVALLTHLLPYTAAGIKFNSDLCAGLGPQPMYDCTQYVGGNITQKYIRYKDAGQWLRGRIIDVQRELLNLLERINTAQEKKQGIAVDGSEEETAVKTSSAKTTAGTQALDATVVPPESEEEEILDYVAEEEKLIREQVSQYKKFIDELKQALKDWEQTAPAVQEFLDHNNIPQTWLSLVLDQELFGMSFPELLLNQLQQDKTTKQPVETKNWTPRVVGIRHRSCHTTRLERMDDHGNINYVYVSNRWLDHPFIDQSAISDHEIHAIRALSQTQPLQSLENQVQVARMNNVPVAERPTHFVLPSVYPSAGRPYYPTPAWYSIFGGDIYEYLSTIISDRLTRKRNSNIIGRIIYLNNDYMQQVFISHKAQSDEKKQAELRDKLYVQINQWLANPDNAGQSLMAFNFTGKDGKEHHSFEIVEIQNDSKATADANEKETAEISSVVFMALGLDARLLGSTPMSLVGTNSGTDIRERFLLRLILKSPQINIMLKPLEVLSRFNGWDKHLTWQVQREVMTTLDRSKTGVTSQSADSEQASASNSEQ